MKPTNKELNILCARCMNIFVTNGGYGPQTTNYIPYRDCPDYCCNRNALQDVYDYLNNFDICPMEYYDKFMEYVVGTQFSNTFTVISTPPKQQVIAFMKATGNWPKEWEEE